jgi:D-sedoheptulose 7-phosphate isomerase
MNTVAEHFQEHALVALKTLEELHEQIALIGRSIGISLSKGATLFWCGNGGSAADSQHLAAELVGRYERNRIALRSIALTTDTSVLTCVANDFCYSKVFSRQIEALAKPGDVLIGISTSGNSPNILSAFNAAAGLNMQTVGLLGNDGGSAKALVDNAIIVPSHKTARIQEMHILIGHILCDLIEMELGHD